MAEIDGVKVFVTAERVRLSSELPWLRQEVFELKKGRTIGEGKVERQE